MSSSDSFSVRVEGLSKRYVVPHRDETKGAMGRIAAHMREFFPFMGRDESDYFWSLRDVSFEVKPGEILGILGRNGSGKSTLLKILSGVTQPTAGRATLRGRVGSLLEVGTGFHPDLTGRENVYMSGVLLGLRRAEIASKFDEIVDFSGIGQFIDVPVKRYSSGMYVRLAYAVASLLRSDILILDEVMAVGDAAFLEKSQKNIEKIANDGRTILFVSHNIHAVRSLCHTGLLLSKGRKIVQGGIEDVVSSYMRDLHGLGEKSNSDISTRAPFVNLAHAEAQEGERRNIALQWIETFDSSGNPSRVFETGDTMFIRIGYKFDQKIETGYFTVFFVDDLGDRVQVLYSLHDANEIGIGSSGVVECKIDDLRLVSGEYSLTVDFGLVIDGHLKSIDWVPDATQIQISLGNYLGPLGLRPNQGALAQRSQWQTIEKY